MADGYNLGMQYRAHLLQVDWQVAGSVRYLLLLAQMPDDGHMENRTVIEGAYMGFSNADSLIDACVRAQLTEESTEQVKKALDLNASLVFVGILHLDSPQLRELGFRTLAQVVEVLHLDGTLRTPS